MEFNQRLNIHASAFDFWFSGPAQQLLIFGAFDVTDIFVLRVGKCLSSIRNERCGGRTSKQWKQSKRRKQKKQRKRRKQNEAKQAKGGKKAKEQRKRREQRKDSKRRKQSKRSKPGKQSKGTKQRQPNTGSKQVEASKSFFTWKISLPQAKQRKEATVSKQWKR